MGYFEKAGGMPIDSIFVSVERSEGSPIIQKTETGYVEICTIFGILGKTKSVSVSDETSVMQIHGPQKLLEILRDIPMPKS